MTPPEIPRKRRARRECASRPGRRWEYAFTVDWLLGASHHGLFDFDHLPDETTLRALLGAPRAVIREVLNDFAAAGLLERARAIGTHATRPTHRTMVGSLGAQYPDRGSVTYEILAAESVEPSPLAAQLFGDEQSELTRVLRLTTWAGMRRALWTNYLPTSSAVTLGTDAWERSAFLVARSLVDGPVRVTYALTAIALDNTTATTFDLPAHTPATHLVRTILAEDRTLVVSFGRIPGVRSSLEFEIVLT